METLYMLGLIVGSLGVSTGMVFLMRWNDSRKLKVKRDQVL